MSKGDYLGEFESLVLLAVARLGGDAYGMRIRREIEARARRTVSIGAVYATVERLESKGYLVSRDLEGSAEIGIRLALGAERGSVVRLMLWEGLRVGVLGSILGIAASLALTRLLSSLLLGLSSTDAATFAGVPALLGLVLLLASYVPARRASAVDPHAALRDE